MKVIDLKMSLLKGSLMKVDNINIKPLTLGEIESIGYTKYMSSVQLLSLSFDDLLDSVFDEDKKKIILDNYDDLKLFDFYTTFGGEMMKYDLLNSLSIILQTEDLFFIDKKTIAVNFDSLGIIERKVDKNGIEFFDYNEEKLESAKEEDIIVINRDNFDNIVKIVKLQNYIDSPSYEDEKEVESEDEEVKKLQQHMKDMNKKVQDRKKMQNEDEKDDKDFSDIVSSVTTKSNTMNKLNVWNFTIYQIYDEYNRLEMIDGYDISIKAMMAGAKDVELTHWSSRG